MANKLESGIIIGMISKLSNEIAMTKALQYTQLRLLAKSQNLDFEKVLKNVESLHAQYMLKTIDDFEDIEKQATDFLEENPELDNRNES
ncbi:hypothetical protein BST83_08835 [Polaribacter filamentus]|uniref:Uncharacterized protein n=1 Tax=Polaribacter filamentus TaxID=53483 RepID=A0A2S7KXC2_9FLAO|nr:hypothetical protein [Polaribacter filamentus]PQB07246.1 hypothetical protein BST83_08835 [Polaribacter filamentus]